MREKKVKSKKKAVKILFFFALFMLIAIIVLNKYILEEVPISERIGTYMPMSVSLNDATFVKAYSTSKYFELLKEGEYEKAYKMLTPEYQRYMSYENYLKTIQGYHFDMPVKQVKQLADHTYIVTLEDTEKQEEHIYFAYANKFRNETFTISPDKFIYYDAPNIKHKSNGLEATVENYLVMQDSITVKMKFKNNTSKEMKIEDVMVEITLSGRLADAMEPITLAPKEEREITLTFDGTSYYIPKSVIVEAEKTTVVIEL
ncbi:MAG: hypothetical protein IJ217_04995 [Clostridia bacterium]|nr:hypothetical protein [Clostridia bacterium]